MFTWYRKWKLRQLQQLQEELEAEARAKEEAGRPQISRLISEEADKYRDSKEPWVTIVGESVTKDGLKLELDWNDAFVKFLKAQGVVGNDDTQIVQKWLAMIAYQTSDSLGQNRAEIEGKISDYE